MKTERKKSLRYAFRFSPAASRLNKGLGCWLVEDDSGLPPVVFQDWEKFKALEFFEKINLPINTMESFTRDHKTFQED